MTYMTFKIKKDWLFYTLFGISCAANAIFLVLLIVSAMTTIGNGELLALSIAMTLTLAAVNGYLVFCILKRFSLNLTTEGITIGDFSKIDIPYTAVRSITKDREPSKHKLYEALLVVKFNKFDTIKVNVEDLENCFDNLKELVQKANLGKKVKEGSYGKDGETLEIAQDDATPATTTKAAPKAATTTTTTTTAAPKAATTTTTTTAAAKPATKKVVTTTTTTTTTTKAGEAPKTTTTKTTK